jgi:hypothetical protein
MSYFYIFILYSFFINSLKKYMISNTNSNRVLTRKEREELVVDFVFHGEQDLPRNS